MCKMGKLRFGRGGGGGFFSVGLAFCAFRKEMVCCCMSELFVSHDFVLKFVELVSI